MKTVCDKNSVKIKGKQGIYTIFAVTENILRCVYTKEETVAEPSMIIEQPLPECSSLQVRETAEESIISTSVVELHIDSRTERFTWLDRKSGRILLQEGGKSLTETDVIRYTTGDEAPVIERVKTVDGERNFIKNLKPVVDRKAWRAKLFFDWKDDEGIYGLGQGEDGIYNYRHQNQYLYQHNMRIPMPFFVSDQGYGILADCCSLMTFQDDANGSYLFFDTVRQLDYYFIAGTDLDEIIAGYRLLTGRATMLPKWAYGYVQSKERYQSADELLEVAQHYRDLQVPLDCVVQDWYSWEENHWGEKKVDKARYGNLRERMDQIHALNVHTMVSVWPNMNAGTTDHTEFLEHGYLLNDLCTYDAFSEEARQLYWKQAREELFDGGFDSWWCDSTEPFSGPDWNGEEKREPWERYVLVGNEHKHFLDPEYANAYALVHAKGIYENQRKTTEEMRVLNLTRSGYASSQRYGAMLWSGDTAARWPVLKQQIAEGLNMGLSGYPYWTLDIGAFFTVKEKWQNRGCCCNTDPTMKWFWQGDYNEGVQDKGYQELYTRWYQMGAFLPMFRSHGTDTPREIWNFGQKGELVYDTLESFTHLRYRLIPYIYSLAGNVYLNHGTIMRSLLFDFASDKKAAVQSGEYMFGPALLVCPVTEPMYYGPDSTPLIRPKTWTCYLPSGCRWYDSWDGTVYEGGADVTVDAPLSRMPLFVRAGSILPLARGLQYADQKMEEPMELRIFPGADGSFTLYEDEGNNYNFEHGAYSTIRFDWDEAAHTLIIGKRQGSHPGMEETRSFQISLARTLCGCDDHVSLVVHYDGREVTVHM